MGATDVEAALRGCGMLRDFTDVGIRILAAAVQEKRVGRGTYAFRGGEPSNGLAFIARGTLQLVPREGGTPLGEVGAGDAVGGVSLLDEGEHLLSAMAAGDVQLLVLSREAFEQLQQSHPGAALKLTLAVARDLAERVREAKGPLREFLMWQISRRPAEGR